MFGAIVAFAVGFAILVLLGRRLLRKAKSRDEKQEQSQSGAPSPILPPDQALRLLESVYKKAQNDGPIFRDEVDLLERSLPNEDRTGEIVGKLIYIWKKAGMAGPKQ